MQRGNRELWLSLLAILLITLAYVLIMNVLQGVPSAGSLFGHGIGILGFLLMLMTEILYSLRKRSRSSRWGRMSSWLQFHIFTGLVGPYMVLLHTSWKFNGLAGLLTLLTIVIVASGFIGRYIYTAVPRTVDGAEVEADELQRQIQATETDLHTWMTSQPEIADRLSGLLSVNVASTVSMPGLILERSFLDWKYRREWRRIRQDLPEAARTQVTQLEQLQFQKRSLKRQFDSLIVARRMLALWQTIHIPIGVAVFTTAFIHVIAVLYFVTQLR
jgi:hypothetical protein